MARFSLIPKTTSSSRTSRRSRSSLRKGAQLLDDMLAVQPPRWELADRIKEAEHTCDQLTHGILHRLHQTFITPFDREDIHALARSLDDVMDAIDCSRRVSCGSTSSSTSGQARGSCRPSSFSRPRS